MRTMAIIGIVSGVGLAGCASGPRGVASMQPPSVAEVPSIRIGHTLVLDPQVDPQTGVHVASEGNGVVVHFAHAACAGTGSDAQFEPNWVDTSVQSAETDPTSPAPAQAIRVVLDDGRRFVAVWKSGDAERGYRAMAQAFNALDSSPRGSSVAISSSDVDVSGPLSAVTYDGHHVVVAFAALANRSLAAVAIPIEAL